MAFPLPSEAETVQRIIADLQSQTGLSGVYTEAVARIMAAEITNLKKDLSEVVNQANLSTASGAGLDQLGFYLAAPRKNEAAATTLGQSKSVKFTNIGNATFNLPAGTRVWASTNINIAFYTSEGVVIPAGTSAFVHVTAVGVGQFYNVGVGEINSHNATTANLVVTNVITIQNGSDTESDSSYRERLLQEFRRRNVLNVDNAIALLRSADGVKDVFLQNLARGSGTFDAIIVPYHESQANNVLELCQQLLNENMPVGVDGEAKLPTNRILDIKISLVFNSTSGNRESIRQVIKSQITSRISSLTVSTGSNTEAVYLSQIKALAIGADNSVIDATLTVFLDDNPMSPEGIIVADLGERIVLRDLVVQ